MDHNTHSTAVYGPYRSRDGASSYYEPRAITGDPSMPTYATALSFRCATRKGAEKVARRYAREHGLSFAGTYMPRSNGYGYAAWSDGW